jgi:long-chain acyl-CoA synthetase
MNLAHLPEKEIEKFGEHVSVIFQDRKWTNIEMRKASKRLANALRKLGVKKGDRVIIQMPNCPEVLQSFLAVYMLGAVVVPINFMVGEAETAFIYKDTGARIIISSSDYIDKITTAGTTGRPKGVMHTHAGLYANAKMQQDTMNLPSGMTGIAVLPLCHSYGIASMNFGMYVGGGATVVLNSFDIENLFASIEKYRAEIIGAVPTMYVFMLLHPDPKKYDLSSMKYWISGSAPLTRETWDRFKETFGAEIIEGWGLTEAGANNSVNPLDGRKKIGSIGMPMKGTVMEVVNETGERLPPNHEGEIIISGPMLMKGYWNRPEETEKVLKNGWLYTGDVGYRDEEGYFFITERKKDLIIKAGENIAPREIEEVLYSHPAVSEAAVVGMPDDVYGEEIKAFVVLLPGKSATKEEIIEHCRAKLKSFKSPKQVVFLDALPKSLVGKILRKELRKM